jgi:preprotein translocase subunit SecG
MFMSVVSFLLSALFVLVCFFLIFVVLIQKGEGGGLGGLAGGAGVDTAFGAKADTTWKRATAIAAGLFMVLTLVLGVVKRPHSVTKGGDEVAVPNSSSAPGPTPGH